MPHGAACMASKLTALMSWHQTMFVTSLGGDLGTKLWAIMPVWAFYLVDLIFAMYLLVSSPGMLPVLAASSCTALCRNMGSSAAVLESRHVV